MFYILVMWFKYNLQKKSLYLFNVIVFKFLFKLEFIIFNDDKENIFRGNIFIKI